MRRPLEWQRDVDRPEQTSIILDFLSEYSYQELEKHHQGEISGKKTLQAGAVVFILNSKIAIKLT